jgi:tryptophan synthase alpha chain
MAKTNRIDQCFARLRARTAGRENREAALVPFLTAGDPDLGVTRLLLEAACRGGADLIELGMPFSDPTADGPAIQRSSARAIAKGVSLPKIFEVVAQLRQTTEVPIVLFGYYNPIFHYGPQRFAADAAAAGVDGVLVVDLPPEEADELYLPARAAGLEMIFLLAPTSDESRVRAVMKKAGGFVYFVSMTGVTGSKQIETDEVRRMVDGLREHCRLPIGVGFGITTPREAAAVARFADAVVVGSAIVRLIEEHSGADDLPARVEDFVRKLKEATRDSAEAAA